MMSQRPSSNDTRNAELLSCLCHRDDLARINLELIFDREKRGRPNPDYLQQTQLLELTPELRGRVVDFLYKVGDYYNLGPHTISKSVAIMDKYLSAEPVLRNDFSRVALVSLSLAARVDECSHPPTFIELCTALKRETTPADFVQLEQSILQTLEWTLNVPTPHDFVVLLLRNASAELQRSTDLVRVHDVAFFYLRFLQMRAEFLAYAPSTCATAALWCALAQLRVDSARWAAYIRSFKAHGLDLKVVDVAAQRLLKLFYRSARAPHSTSASTPARNSAHTKTIASTPPDARKAAQRRFEAQVAGELDE